MAAAKDAQAEAELQRDIRRINATSKPEAEKAAAIAEARARMEAKYRKADPTVQSKMADMEKVLAAGNPLAASPRSCDGRAWRNVYRAKKIHSSPPDFGATCACCVSSGYCFTQ